MKFDAGTITAAAALASTFLAAAASLGGNSRRARQRREIGRLLAVRKDIPDELAKLKQGVDLQIENLRRSTYPTADEIAATAVRVRPSAKVLVVVMAGTLASLGGLVLLAASGTPARWMVFTVAIGPTAVLLTLFFAPSLRGDRATP